MDGKFKELTKKVEEVLKGEEIDMVVLVLENVKTKLLMKNICSKLNNTLKKLRYMEHAQVSKTGMKIPEGKSPIQELIDKLDKKGGK